MKCKTCGYENPDSAKFCSECGSRLEEEMAAPAVEETEETEASDAAGELEAEIEALEEAAVPVEETEMAAVIEEEPVTAEEPVKESIWYYVENGAAVGPVNDSQMREKTRAGAFNKNTYVLPEGAKEWMHLDTTSLASELPSSSVTADEAVLASAPAQEQNQSAAAPEEPAAALQWYYVKNNQTFGPFTEDAMKQFIQAGELNRQSYVWNQEMTDWMHLSDTSLASSLPASGNTQGRSFQNSYNPNSSEAARSVSWARVPQRSVLLYIVLSILTCGLFYICWMYILAKDINELAGERGFPKACDPVLTVIFTLLSCGIYQIYFFWKEGSTVYRMQRNTHMSDSSTLLAVLAIFIPIASAAILQDQVNTLAAND